jgi:hypothetical protein
MNHQYTIPIEGYEPDPMLQQMIDHLCKTVSERRYSQIERFLVTHGAEPDRDRLVYCTDSYSPDSIVCETLILVPKEMLGPDGLRDNMTINDAKARFPWTQIKVMITTGGKVR